MCVCVRTCSIVEVEVLSVCVCVRTCSIVEVEVLSECVCLCQSLPAVVNRGTSFIL